MIISLQALYVVQIVLVKTIIITTTIINNGNYHRVLIYFLSDTMKFISIICTVKCCTAIANHKCKLFFPSNIRLEIEKKEKKDSN